MSQSQTINAPKVALPNPSRVKQRNAAPLQMDFTVQATYMFNLQLYADQGNIGGISGLYFDNLDNTGTMTIQVAGGQRLIFPAKSAGYIPVIMPSPIQFSVTSSVSGGGGVSTCAIQLLNYEEAPFLWTLP